MLGWKCTKGIFPRLISVPQYNICQSQRAGMALGMGVRELSGSVLGLMTGAKLLQVGLCYTGSRDYLVHRDCTAVHWGGAVYRCTATRRELSRQWTALRSRLWRDCHTVTYTRHTPRPVRSSSCDNTQNYSQDRSGKVCNLNLFGFSVRREYFSICR